MPYWEVSGFCRAILKRLILKCLSITAMRLTHINNNKHNQNLLSQSHIAHCYKLKHCFTLHVSDLVHGFRVVISTTPQWISGLNSRSEATERPEGEERTSKDKKFSHGIKKT